MGRGPSDYIIAGRKSNMARRIKFAGETRIIFTALLVVGALSLSVGDAYAASEKILTLGFSSLPVNFNTLERNDDAILDVLYPPIVQYDDDRTIHPILAESVDASKDGQVYTVKLRKTGWSDGTPLTADDVLFTIDSIANPKAIAVATSRFAIFQGADETGHPASKDGHISGIQKIDAQTIRFTCKYPVNQYVFYNAMMFLRPQPRHLLRDIPIEQFPTQRLFQTASVTSGPYRAVNYVQNQYLELEPNTSYYARPKIDRIFVKIVDSSSLVAQLKTGEIDANITSLPYSDIALARSIAGVTVAIPDSMPVFRYLIINAKTISDPRLRLAISYAIDRDAMVQSIISGTGSPTSGPYNTDNLYFDKKYQTPYDPNKAKALLAESGWDLSKPILLRSSTRSPAVQQMGEMVNSYLTAIGLKVNFQLSDHATELSRTRAGDYDISVLGYGWTPFEPDVSVFYGTGGSFNLSKYSNPEADALLKAGIKEVDTSKRKKIYSDFQALFAREMPCTLLYGEKYALAYDSRLVNYVPKAYGPFNDITKWDVK
jgi:peptide/nickel transport system substrate-binding protein